VDFLDTVSLAHFTAICKEYRPLLDLEVARRKAKIQEYAERVKQLIGCEGEEPEFYVRANVEVAEKLCQAAMHLIACGPFFRDERARFVPPSASRTGSSLDEDDGADPRSQQYCLLMLPTILYLPRTGEPVHPGREANDKAKRFCYSLTHDEQDGYEIPRFAFQLASEPQVIEAFRYAARKIVWRSKLAAMSSMTFVLRMAEEFGASHPSLQ
jgi:hypothetical protein